MHPTLIRQTSTVASSILNLLPKKLPPSLSLPEDANLYQVLSRAPGAVKGKEVHQARWSHSGKVDAFWRITDARFKCGGKHGKARGILYIDGKKVNRKPEVIRSALKYSWVEGRSRPIAPSPSPAKAQAESAPIKQLKYSLKRKPAYWQKQ